MLMDSDTSLPILTTKGIENYVKSAVFGWTWDACSDLHISTLWIYVIFETHLSISWISDHCYLTHGFFHQNILCPIDISEKGAKYGSLMESTRVWSLLICEIPPTSIKVGWCCDHCYENVNIRGRKYLWYRFSIGQIHFIGLAFLTLRGYYAIYVTGTNWCWAGLLAKYLKWD